PALDACRDDRLDLVQSEMLFDEIGQSIEVLIQRDLRATQKRWPAVGGAQLIHDVPPELRQVKETVDIGPEHPAVRRHGAFRPLARATQLLLLLALHQWRRFTPACRSSHVRFIASE